MGSRVHSDEPCGNPGIAGSIIFPRVFSFMELVIIVINCSVFIRNLYNFILGCCVE
jgi:hypothetical protein